MSLSDYKAVAAKNLVWVSGKRYGYNSRHTGCSLFDLQSSNPCKPSVSVPKLRSCSREECKNVETKLGEYSHCGNCLTVYCSRECQRTDWFNHKSFCKSEEAYISHLSKWEETLDPSVDYNKAWREWIRTPKMIKILKFIGKTEDELASHY